MLEAMSNQTLREPTYFILTALIDGPLHGYAIAQHASELSDGRVDLGAGTLYGALTRLIDQKLIREVGEEIVNGRTRRIYELTNDGHETVSSEADRLRDAARAAHSKLASGGAGRVAAGGAR